ncbi:MAG: CBS domain-containing protein [Gemmataceae bacterium]|nr:CBS domain-containing protein [Gemmataceae bacterium]
MATSIAAKPLLELRADDLMSRDVITVPRDMSIKGAARMLAQAQVSGAPVVNEEGRCVGVIAATDFVRWVEGSSVSRPGRSRDDCVFAAWQIPDEQSLREGCVAAIMTKDPVTAVPATPIGELAQMMLDAHIHRVIIVDEAKRPLGVVSSTDILAAIARANPRARGVAPLEGD